MLAVQTLIRRTAAALGAIAALTVPGLATAQQTVTLTGVSSNSCSYTGSMTVKPDGSLDIQCSGSTAATYTLSAPASLSQSITAQTQVRVTRSGSLALSVEVGYEITGGPCTVVASPVTIGANSNFAYLPITTLAATDPVSKCVVKITAPTGATSSIGIDIVNPDANVTFAFASPSAVTNVGGGPVTIRVNRGGGTAGAFTVPLVLSGSMAPAGALLAGNLSAASLSFVAGDDFKSVTYTPPSLPTTPSTPLDLALSFGAIAPNGAQLASGSGVHTLRLNGPAVGCPVPETVANSMMNAYANGVTLRMPSNMISTYVLPPPALGKSTGQFYLASGTSSYPVAPYYFEIHINKCKGLVQAPPGTTVDTCYTKFATKTGYKSMVWFTKLLTGNTSYDTEAEIRARGYCYAPASEGPWYVNIRYVYAGCDISGNCGWNYQWQNWTY